MINLVYRNKFEGLQILRAFGAIFVLLFHATILFNEKLNYHYLFNFFKFGYSGVDIFFVLSGFIIYYVHSKDIGLKKHGLKFIKKRFLRVYPIYWIVLTLVAPIYYLVPNFGSDEIKEIPNIIKSYTLFPQYMNNQLLTVSWTLSHEVWFYFLFSLLIFFDKRISKLILIIISSFTLIFIFFNISESLVLNFIFSPLNFEFLMGCIIAYYSLNKTMKYGYYSFLTGIIIFSASSLLVSSGIVNLHRVIQFGVPAAIITYSIVSIELNNGFSKNRLLSYIGDASYSIYLVHFPLLSLWVKVFNSLNIFNLLNNLISSSLIILLTLVCSCFFHELIEKPILRLINNIFSRTAKKQKVITI